MWLVFQLTAVVLWAGVNVLDSHLVERYRPHPIVVMWHQSMISLLLLTVFAVFVPLRYDWAAPLLLVGCCAYVGDLVFFRALERIDVSVTNISWAILSVFLSISGFLFFAETWTGMETAGVLLILSGMIVLSLWQRTVGDLRSFFLLPLLAFLYTPFYVMQEAGLQHGLAVHMVFFWPVLAREVCALTVPLLVPALRRRLQLFAKQKTGAGFHAVNGMVILLFFSATFFTASAFSVGPLSLTGIVANIQPFIVLSFGWLLLKFAPTFAPRELLTARSVWIKITSFLIVFFGLALLAVSQ